MNRKLVFALFASIFFPAQANSKAPVAPLLPQYKQECAACHLAYPAGMLPAKSWAD
jgi:hypothetical protein